MNEIHGHAVMEMMVNAQGSFTRDSLKRTIIEKFGSDTRFFTCSAQGMDADQLIRFLESKGKFHPVGEGFSTSPDKICNH